VDLQEGQVMRCPFFEEVLVAFCRAYPVKKMVPSDRLQTNCICTCEGFEDCLLFREVMAKLENVEGAGPGAGRKDPQGNREGKGV
jgi:hypothetical protein